MPPDTCPNCGADVPRHARACPACGSDEKTGWSNQAAYDHLDLPGESFEYQEFVEHEFAPQRALRPRGWILWTTIALALSAFLIWRMVR